MYQIQVRLQRVRPPVWRRLEVSPRSSLALLHHAIQSSFGWEDCHLHEFSSGRHRIGPIDEWADAELRDEEHVYAGDVLVRRGDSILYVYDFGDDWRHTIELEAVVPTWRAAQHSSDVQRVTGKRTRATAGDTPALGLPRCTDGRGSAPAEDSGPTGRSGGTRGAIDLVEVNAALAWLREPES